MQNCEVIRLDSIDGITKARKRIVIGLANNSPTIFFAQTTFSFKHDLQNIKRFDYPEFKKTFYQKFIDYRKSYRLIDSSS